MAAATVICAKGTLLKKGSTTITEIVSISIDGIERGTIDVSHMESPDNAMEFIGECLTDSGTITLGVNCLPGDATHKDLLTELYGGTPDTYNIVFPTTPAITWPMTAFPTNFNGTFEVKGKMTSGFQFKVTGKPSFPA